MFRMVESGCRTSLATKTFQGLGIVSYLFRQELQSHESAMARVLGLIDNTHTATAELLNDAVVRDDLGDHSELPVFVPLHLKDVAAASQRKRLRHECVEPRKFGPQIKMMAFPRE